MLHVGFAACCVTPPLGKEIPGLFERRLAVGVHDDLYARAAVMDDGATCAAFVQVDAISLVKTIVADARRQAHRLCGIPAKHCFIAATHTHSGGPVSDSFLSRADRDYRAFLADRIASAIAEAFRRRRSALAGAGTAKADGVAFNRRFLMKDGFQRTHPGKMHPEIVAPAGPADPTVTVLGFREPDSATPFGAVVNFACHATHMNGVLYSADYPRYIVDTLRAVYGPDFGVVFLNGACGDVTQYDNRSERPGEFGLYWCRRTGQTVGGAALQALARMDHRDGATLDVASRTLSAPIRATSAAERRAARGLLAARGVTLADKETIYAQELLEVEALRRKQPKRRLEIMGVRVGDTLFWGVPSEYFQALALQVRDRSPFPHTCCIELANGNNGYICTREAYGGGGYEVRIARSSLLAEDTGDRIAGTAIRLAGALYKRAAAEVEALPKRTAWIAEESNALEGIEEMDQDTR